MKIKHLSHFSINKKNWDELILQADNGLVYALSWYLDIITPKWEALISSDLKYVMPVPIKYKYKLPYIVQPLMAQQLGVFGKAPVPAEIIRMFVKNLPSYSYQLNLNHANLYPKSFQMPNYVLSLADSYDKLSRSFSKNTARNIQKAEKKGLKIVHDYNTEDFLKLYESVNRKYKSPDLETMHALITQGLERNIFQIKAVSNKKGDVIAALCYTLFKDRFTYLIPVSNEQGKKDSAMFYLVDHLIKKASGTDILLDFEGSSIPGVAQFYRGFGAVNQPYHIIKKLRPSFLVGRV
jgi:lipid II:glycine glycyltransferase (peptidoglycan interpeptide bridge formation enzyme)